MGLGRARVGLHGRVVTGLGGQQVGRCRVGCGCALR